MYLTKYLQGISQIGCLSLYVKEGNHLSLIVSTVHGVSEFYLDLYLAPAGQISDPFILFF